MKRYMHKKSGVIVRAEEFTSENLGELANACGGQIISEIDPFDAERRIDAIQFKVPSGKKRIYEGCFLVSFEGNFFAPSKELFLQNYELLDGLDLSKTETDDPWRGFPRIGDV